MDGEITQTVSNPVNSSSVNSDMPTENESGNTGSNPETVTTEQSSEGKPAGFDPVDIKTATPEQVEARLNRLYGNMKRFEGDAKQQRELNEALVRELTNMRTAQEQVVNHIQQADYQDAEQRLMTQRQEAWNKGDFDGYNNANDKINEIKIQRKLNEERIKSQPKPQAQQQQRGVNGPELADNAAGRGAITPEEAEITKAWMAETDQVGNFKRPWASDTSDPRNYAAALEAQAVFNSPLFADKPIAEKLKEVDRRMGIQTQASRTNVLPAGNLTNGTRTNTIKLDPAIEKIAIRTKFGGPKAKSDQDHIDAWKRAVAKQGSRK